MRSLSEAWYARNSWFARSILLTLARCGRRFEAKCPYEGLMRSLRKQPRVRLGAWQGAGFERNHARAEDVKTYKVNDNAMIPPLQHALRQVQQSAVRLHVGASSKSHRAANSRVTKVGTRSALRLFQSACLARIMLLPLCRIWSTLYFWLALFKFTALASWK